MIIRSVTAGLVLLTVLLSASAPPAEADQGVSIDLGSVSVSGKLSPGGRYRLPTLTVRNIGDEPGDYEVAVVHLETGPRERAPATWFDLNPARFHLMPDQPQQVQVHIDLPTGADPGEYEALVQARPVAGDSGVRVTAAAASRISFEVRPSSLWAAWTLQARRWFDDHSPWSFLLPMGLLLAALLFVSRRYIRVRVGVERRR